MDWRRWLRDWGLPAPASPDVESIVLAILIAIGAFWIGWFAGRRLGSPIAAFVRRWTGRGEEGFGARLAGAVAHYGLAALLLLVAADAARLSPIGQMIVAVALGIASAMLVLRLAASTGLGAVPAGMLSFLALVAATAGSLGGHPLIAGLAGVGLTVGTHHLTLLGIVNFVVVAAVLYVLARLANRVLLHSLARAKRLDVSQRAPAQKLSSIGVVVVAVLLGIDLLGIDLTALTVFSGAFGLAVGFGLQKTLDNLIAGLILLMDRSVKPGDVIVVGDTFR
jgi:small-conductance mechanosensitive channel